jgi:hypothetical protein
MKLFKSLMKFSLAVLPLAAATLASAGQLSTDARSAVPHEVQQLVVIDYRAMQNSRIAMQLRDHLMPPELRQFDDALRKSGMNDNHDVEELAFALFRTKPNNSEDLQTVGIAQGQFSMDEILANIRKQHQKATLLRGNKIYPMTRSGMVLCFVDPSTMVFGQKEAVVKALDARDGISANIMRNSSMMDAMRSVDSEPLWSILDNKGTQIVMKSVLGEAGSLTDYDVVRKRLDASWYSMSFQHGVKFDLTIVTGDTIAAATISSLLSAAMLVRKMSGSEAEKQAMNATTVSSSAGKLQVRFAANDSEFGNLLQSSLFKNVVR